MKRFFGLLLAVGGAAIILVAGSSLLLTGQSIYGYHAMYPGLLGIALLTFGLILRQD